MNIRQNSSKFNTPTLAIGDVDTAENGPSKVLQGRRRLLPAGLEVLHGAGRRRGLCDGHAGEEETYVATNFIRHLTNFRRSVLGCIDSYDSESRRIFQDFSRSTRCAFLCTAPKSEFRQISQFFVIFRDFCDFFQNFTVFRLKFGQNFSDFNEFAIFAKSGKF